MGRCERVLHRHHPSQLDPNNWWIKNASPDIIPNAFKWAHAADPNALLFFNDYNITGEDGSNAKSDAVYAYVKQLLADGVPIHGVGSQGHLDTQYGWNPALVRQDLERFASLGLKVAMTEADVRTFVNNATDQVPTDNLALFAHPYEYSEMLKAALAVPECISFTVWGFTDSDSWVPSAFAWRRVRGYLRREPAAEGRLLRPPVGPRARRLRRAEPGADLHAARLIT